MGTNFTHIHDFQAQNNKVFIKMCFSRKRAFQGFKINIFKDIKIVKK